MLRSFTGSLAAVALTLLSASTASAAWNEARSRHFIVYSEGDRADLIEAAKKLEKFDFLLRAVSNVKTDRSRVPVKIYLMPDRQDVQATMGMGGSEGVGGYYWASSRGPIAVGTRFDFEESVPGFTRAGGPITDGTSSEAVLLHEYTHHFMFQNFPAAYPSWYSEGFAEYYGTTRFLDNNVIEVGHAAPGRIMSFEDNDWLPLSKMLAAQSYSDVGDRLYLLYAEGWLLVHYLGNAPHRKGQLARYLDLLNRGVDYKTATDQAFGADAKQLDLELRAYARKGRLQAVRLPFKPIDTGPVTVRALSPAEDALVESDITLGRGVFVSEAKKFAASVERLASRVPRDPYALSILAEAQWRAGNRASASTAVDNWLAVSPDNPRALLMRARLTTDALRTARSTNGQDWENARSIILRANKLAPNDPAIHEAYYDSFVAQGLQPPAGAQNALVKAFELVPQDENIRFKLAADFEARGMIEDAIVIIKPIAAEAHDSSGDSDSERARRKRLEQKYRVVGDSIDGDAPRAMLARLEAKLAAKRKSAN